MQYIDIARLVLEAANGARRLAEEEIRQIIEHIAQAGSDSVAMEYVGGRVRDREWQGRILRGRDRLSPSDAHYVRHVIAGHEWPAGTTQEQYIASIEQAIRNPDTTIFVSLYEDREWQVGYELKLAPSRIEELDDLWDQMPDWEQADWSLEWEQFLIF